MIQDERTVWKFPLTGITVEGEVNLRMPVNSQPLCIQVQEGKPCLWVLAYPNNPQMDYHFYIVGTGQPVESDWQYVGTWQEPPYVWHLFHEWTLGIIRD